MRLYYLPLLLLLAWPACAQREESSEYHRHHLALLLGGSHNTEKNGSTAGGDYEFRFTRAFGVIATGEYVGGGFREDVFAFTPAVHPWRGLKLLAGAGFDRELARHDAARAGEDAHDKNVRALFRFGGGYDFHLGRGFTAGPDFAIDFLKGEKVLVYGINIGFGFQRR